MTSTTIKRTLNELAVEHQHYLEALNQCDPSACEISQKEFFELQDWAEDLEAIAWANGFTIEQVEDASDALI